MSKKHHDYSVRVGERWVVGFSYPPQGQQEDSEGAIRMPARDGWALTQGEPFVWPSAGPMRFVQREIAVNIALALDGVVHLADDVEVRGKPE